MDYRKLIQFGKSSYVVSVPSFWIKKHGLNKGDTLHFSENGNNELVINTFKKEEKKESKNIVIDTNKKNNLRVRRELISAYLNGYNNIKLSGKNVEEYSKDVKNIVNDLMMGFEIIEKNKDYFIIQDFLDLNSVSIKDNLRKMDIATRLIFSELKSIHNPPVYNTILGYEGDINKHMFLTIKFVREVLTEPNLAKSLNLDQKKILESWQISHHVERIADKLNNLAIEIKKLDKESKLCKDVFELYSKIENYYLDVMKSYYNNDINLAYVLSNERDQLLEVFKKLNDGESSLGIYFLLKELVSSIHKIVRRTYS